METELLTTNPTEILHNLLEKIRDGFARVEELEYWNQKATENGNIITKKRKEFVEFLNNKEFFLDVSLTCFSY